VEFLWQNAPLFSKEIMDSIKKGVCNVRTKLRVPVLDLCSHSHESLLNISGIFCTCLHERDPNFISKSLNKDAISLLKLPDSSDCKVNQYISTCKNKQKKVDD
jgi:hypothetical protein